MCYFLLIVDVPLPPILKGFIYGSVLGYAGEAWLCTQWVLQHFKTVVYVNMFTTLSDLTDPSWSTSGVLHLGSQLWIAVERTLNNWAHLLLQERPKKNLKQEKKTL